MIECYDTHGVAMRRSFDPATAEGSPRIDGRREGRRMGIVVAQAFRESPPGFMTRTNSLQLLLGSLANLSRAQGQRDDRRFGLIPQPRRHKWSRVPPSYCVHLKGNVTKAVSSARTGFSQRPAVWRCYLAGTRRCGNPGGCAQRWRDGPRDL